MCASRKDVHVQAHEGCACPQNTYIPTKDVRVHAISPMEKLRLRGAKGHKLRTEKGRSQTQPYSPPPKAVTAGDRALVTKDEQT